MKHNTKITTILISMFIITQLIGLFVVSTYINGLELPYGVEPPKEVTQQPRGPEIIVAFVIAVILFFLLIKIKAEMFIRLWYFVVTILALALAFKPILILFFADKLIEMNLFSLKIYTLSLVSFMLALPLSYIKIFKRHLVTHNLTELLIYPGIAAVFIPLLNVFWIVILLLLISLYDIWAVWHSEFMQKMAKFQINNLKFFTGFFVPYADKKEKMKINLIRDKYAKNPNLMEKEFKKAKIKINLAILGGGDIIFPIITAGLFYKFLGILPALIIIASATIALLFLFILAKKGKFYPAMPFISIGMYLGMIISWMI